MKKLFMLAVIITVLSSCNNGTNKVVNNSNVDSCVVDTCVVDSVVTDSVN